MGERVLSEELLNNEFNLYVFNKKYKSTIEEKRKWDLYYSIIEELTHMGDYNNVNEIKYRITDGEEPSEVLMEKIYSLDKLTFNLRYLLDKL